MDRLSSERHGGCWVEPMTKYVLFSIKDVWYLHTRHHSMSLTLLLNVSFFWFVFSLGVSHTWILHGFRESSWMILIIFYLCLTWIWLHFYILVFWYVCWNMIGPNLIKLIEAQFILLPLYVTSPISLPSQIPIPKWESMAASLFLFLFLGENHGPIPIFIWKYVYIGVALSVDFSIRWSPG